MPLSVGLRINNVQDYFVPGEIVSFLRGPLSGIYGSDTPIVIGGGDALDGVQLHSMNLAAALSIQDKFRTDTVALPKLLKSIFDENLYAASGAGNKAQKRGQF